MALLGASCFMLTSASQLLHSCSDDEPTKWVDLRYKTEDVYIFSASGEDSYTIQVKSTDPWSVSAKENWSNITPDHGDADKIYDIAITCKENTDLDDRIDTVTIKSDYWVGKRFVINQKGIAYLNVEGIGFIMAKTSNATAAFQVVSNQKWTAKVTEGEQWLSITAGESGEQNGTISITATGNNGEKRTGKVSIYDRHGVVRQIVDCTQDGVTLTPEIPENGKWFALQSNAQRMEIDIDADIEWSVAKDNEEDAWFSINTASTTSHKLVLDVLKNSGSTVRVSSVTLTSTAAEGSEPVIKQIKFRQINAPYVQTKILNKKIGSGGYVEKNLSYGEYHFFMKPPMKLPGQFQISLRWQWGKGTSDLYYVQYNLTDGVAAGLTSPWNSPMNMEETGYHRAVDTNQENSIGFKVELGKTDFVDPSTGKPIANFIWYVNKKVVVSLQEVPHMLLPGGLLWEHIINTPAELNMFYRGSDGGSIFVEKYEYIAPLDWGED